MDRGAAVARLVETGIRTILASDAILFDDQGLPRLNEGALYRLDGTTRIRLEVRRGARCVLIDGTPRQVPGQPFSLLVMLARNATERRGPVTTHEFSKATRRELRDVVRELKQALPSNRPGAANISDRIVSRQGVGYELILDPSQILVVP
jgi:hypothetical protein